MKPSSLHEILIIRDEIIFMQKKRENLKKLQNKRRNLQEAY